MNVRRAVIDTALCSACGRRFGSRRGVWAFPGPGAVCKGTLCRCPVPLRSWEGGLLLTNVASRAAMAVGSVSKCHCGSAEGVVNASRCCCRLRRRFETLQSAIAGCRGGWKRHQVPLRVAERFEVFKSRVLLWSALTALMFIPTGIPAAQFPNSIRGYSLTYPDSWNANLRESDGMVILRSFPPDQAPTWGFVPFGGAQILVASYPPYDNPGFPQGIDDYSALDINNHNHRVISRTDPSSGQPARVTSVFDAFNTRFVDSVIHRGGKVFRVILECTADDPNIPAYDQILDAVITSISVAAITPAPASPTP